MAVANAILGTGEPVTDKRIQSLTGYVRTSENQTAAIRSRTGKRIQSLTGPTLGAWIETIGIAVNGGCTVSLPMRGAWIETVMWF